MATIFPIYFHGHLPYSQDLAIYRLLTLIPDTQIGQAKPGHEDGFMTALAWLGVLKSQSKAAKPRLFGGLQLAA
jgi:hypothetical protein